MPALLISCYFLLPRIYKTIHRPPYEIVKTEDLSSNFLSLQEIQTAYSKFKQLFLIGEKNAEQKLSVRWGKTCRVDQVKVGAIPLGSSWLYTEVPGREGWCHGAEGPVTTGPAALGTLAATILLQALAPLPLLRAVNTEPPSSSLPSPVVSVELLP